MRDYVERVFGTYFDDTALHDFEPALLHADLSPDHIRFSVSEQRITGIIDWGDASIGDPDYDLSYLYPAMGARFVEEVIRHGPRRDLEKLRRKLEFFMRARHRGYCSRRAGTRRSAIDRERAGRPEE